LESRGSHTLLLEDLKERRGLERDKTLTGKVVDGFLRFLHTSDVVGKGGLFVQRRRGIESEKLGQNLTVLAVLMNTKFDILGECFVEGFEIRDVQRELRVILLNWSLSSAISWKSSRLFLTRCFLMT